MVHDGLIAIPNAESTKFYKNSTVQSGKEVRTERVVKVQVVVVFV